MLLITETFHSIQGEGVYSGIPMFFIRTNRCNLRCTWCDSTYSFYGGKEIPLAELYADVDNAKEEWVCFTGGEPLIQAEAYEFLEHMSGTGKKTLIETSGSIDIGKYSVLRNVYFDMDIKVPSSNEEGSFLEKNIKALKRDDYVKFVIKDQKDYDFARSKVSNLGNIEVVFQPCYGTSLKWLAESVLADGLNVRVMPQLHKLIWGEKRGV